MVVPATDSQPFQVAAAALTDRERAVVALAADGLTNKEIAKTLYISAKTVEYHLSHAFTKLSITSRRQLRTAVRHSLLTAR